MKTAMNKILLPICVFVFHFWMPIYGRMIATEQNILVRNEDIPVAELVANPDCLLPKDRGNECKLEDKMTNKNTSKGMKWFFDPLSLRCLAFGYKGCNGNANRFDTINECHEQCMLKGVYGHCVGGERATAHNENGQEIVCSHSTDPSTNNTKCPIGYQCQMMMAHGICCHTKTFEKYARNYHPKCDNGLKLLRVFDQHNQQSVEVLGQKCEDEFCPQAIQCHQQEQFAYCCL